MLDLLSTDVARANKIVTDLLDFARIKKITKSPIKLDEFINNFLDSMDFGENIHIKRELETVRVELDPDKMSQVLLNILSNSRDAMPEGGNITIAARKNETMAVIHITDTGQGMDEETMEHIFDPLFSTKTRGLGLSLAIVKEIIDLHSGTINVISSKGKGTSFDINLPL
jgi:two-component system sensor histidine kinase AtoS